MKPFSAIGAFLIAASLVSAAPAGAQTKEQKAGARAAAEAGGDAFDAGRYAEAADLFERAERLVHAPPHLLYAARSNVKLGRLVEARELYLTLTREQLPDSAPRPFRDALQLGEKELAELEPRIGYVSVVVQGGAGATSVVVTRNGQPIPAELLGVPTPSNPGEYSYQATAEGMESAPTSIRLREGGRETVLLTLHEIPGYVKKSSPAGASTGGPPSTGSTLATTPQPDGGPSGGRPLLVGSIASFGVAVAGGVVGTLFLMKGSDTRAKSNELCGRSGSVNEKGEQVCLTEDAPAIKKLDHDATLQQGIGIAGIVTGGVGLAAGITLLILDQNRASLQSGARVTPIIGTNYLGIRGSF